MVQAPNRYWLEVLGVWALQLDKSQKVQQVRHGKSHDRFFRPVRSKATA